MNKRIISITGLFGIIGWLTVAGLSIVILRRSPQAAPTNAAPHVPEIPRIADRDAAERGRTRNTGPVTEEDWKEAKQFLETHSPNRVHLIERIERGPYGETRESLKKFLVHRWRNIIALKSTSPELYNTRVRELELDDDVFGICHQLKRGLGNRQQLQAELNTKITDLFNLGLIERKQRISLVEQSLVDQRKTLESDERDKVKLAQEQYEYVLKHGVDGARLDISTHHSSQKSKSGSSTVPSPGESDSE